MEEQVAFLQYTFLTGFVLGGISSAQQASLQFLAENQHEHLTKRSHAIAFHRARNYRMMAGFGIGGCKRGLQLTAVAAAYLGVKEAINRLEPKVSQFGDLIAGAVVGSSVFSLASNRVVLI